MFEFNGEYHNTGSDTDWWGIVANLLGVLIATIISWIIFNIGNRRARQSEEKRLQELEQYIYINIPLICILIDTQIGYMQKFVTELKRIEEGEYPYEYAVALHAKSLRWISHYDFLLRRVSAGTLRKSC